MGAILDSPLPVAHGYLDVVGPRFLSFQVVLPLSTFHGW